MTPPPSDSDIRFLNCPSCGSPKLVNAGEDPGTCEYCGSEMVPSDSEMVPSDSEMVPSDREMVPSDREIVPSEADSAPSPVAPEPVQASEALVSSIVLPSGPDEEERLVELWEQAEDYRPHLNTYAFNRPPRGVRKVKEDDPERASLLPQDLAEAMARCRKTPDNPDAQRRLYWLARKTWSLWTFRRDPGQAREALETALELLPDQGHQQIIRCLLADISRAEGDLQSAMRLLERCDARSSLLDVDSVYRTTAAHLALASGDHDLALKLVGEDHDERPFEPASLPLATMIRVTVLEQRGETEEADRELRWLKGRTDLDLLASWITEANRGTPLAATAQTWARVKLPKEKKRRRVSPARARVVALPVEVPERRQKGLKNAVIIIVIAMVGLGVVLYEQVFSEDAVEVHLDAATRQAQAIPIALNQPTRGRLAESSDDHVYAFSLERPTQMTITVASDFDTYLELYRASDTELLLEDDDSGEDLNAMLNAPLAPGDYHLVVHSYDHESTGDYTLNPVGAALAGQPAAPEGSARYLRAGEQWVGTYVCAQGRTIMTLSIRSVDGTQVDSTFRFQTADNTMGEFHMSGTFDPSTKRLLLVPGAWIQDPTGFTAAGLDGTMSSDGSKLTGRITHEACGEFEAYRAVGR